MYNFICPKCSKESSHADPSKTYECGDCNFPTYQGIQLVRCLNDEEVEELKVAQYAQPELNKRRTEMIEAIVKDLLQAKDIIICQNDSDEYLTSLCEDQVITVKIILKKEGE